MKKEFESLERRNSNPNAIYRLLREPMVHRELRVRRTRIGDHRAFFVVDVENCRVVIVAVRHRRSHIVI